MSTYEELGRRLRDARLERKLEIADIAQTLHIRPRYLEALEEAALHDLPGNAFIIGYVSRYAWLLELPAEELAEEYRRIGTLPGRQMFTIPDSMRKEQHPPWRLVALTFFMALLLLLAWSLGHRRTAEVHMAQVSARQEQAPTLPPAGCIDLDVPAWPPCYYGSGPVFSRFLPPRRRLHTIMELAP